MLLYFTNIKKWGISMKTVGVIGGLGPETTSEFYLEIIFGCKRIDEQALPHIIIGSVPAPYAVVEKAITGTDDKREFIPFLTAEAKKLEKADVDFIVMPCNTLHAYIEEIRNSVKVPVLSIVEETCRYIKENKFEKVGLISTAATVKHLVYENIMNQEAINYLTPNGLQRAEMSKIVNRLVVGNHLNSDRDILLDIIKDLKAQGVDSIALACTDLQLLLPDDKEVVIFDTMKVLAEAVIRELNSD